MTTLYVIGGIILISIVYFVLVYNTLVELKTTIHNAWSNIDTELKRRYELIPNIITVVKGYAAHEKQVFERVAELRQQCLQSQGAKQQAGDETQLVDGLKKLFAIAEAYPDLKADQHFLALQKELINTENRIQAARRFYNGNVRDYQTKCQTFPSVFVASMYGFKPLEYFDVEPAVRDVPLV